MTDNVPAAAEAIESRWQRRRKNTAALIALLLAFVAGSVAAIWLGLPQSEPSKLLTISILLMSGLASVFGVFLLAFGELNFRVTRRALRKGLGIRK